MGAICLFRTPLIKVTLKNKNVLEFFTEREFRDWAEHEGVKQKGWSFKYFKGLGTSSTADFNKYMQNMDDYLFSLFIENSEDTDSIDLAFNSQRADDRKKWLETSAENFEDYVI